MKRELTWPASVVSGAAEDAGGGGGVSFCSSGRERKCKSLSGVLATEEMKEGGKEGSDGVSSEPGGTKQKRRIGWTNY